MNVFKGKDSKGRSLCLLCQRPVFKLGSGSFCGCSSPNLYVLDENGEWQIQFNKLREDERDPVLMNFWKKP